MIQRFKNDLVCLDQFHVYRRPSNATDSWELLLVSVKSESTAIISKAHIPKSLLQVQAIVSRFGEERIGMLLVYDYKLLSACPEHRTIPPLSTGPWASVMSLYSMMAGGKQTTRLRKDCRVTL